MKLTFTNEDLLAFYALSGAVSAKGKEARAASKFKKILLTKAEEYQEFYNQIADHYYDRSGEKPVLIKGVDKNQFASEIGELNADEVVIDLTEFEPFVKLLISAFENWDQKLSGADADYYDKLLDLLEAV